MSTDDKNAPNPPSAPPAHYTPGVKIFTYPKVIFLIPTLLAALICGIGMTIISDETRDPKKTTSAPSEPAGADARTPAASEKAAGGAPGAAKTTATKADAKTSRTGAKAVDGASATDATPPAPIRRFSSPQNILGIIFISVFFLNLLVMSIDFPRFTVVAVVLGIAALGFFFLWLNVFVPLIRPITDLLETIFAVANAGFYFALATAMLINLAIIWVTRYLDFWEIRPNEILHNHGPFSDLERFPTFNLKFDKEIPDILEYALLRSGRLVLHVSSERRAIVLDNVLWIDNKEAELKKLMSRLDVRVTTDQEAGEPI